MPALDGLTPLGQVTPIGAEPLFDQTGQMVIFLLVQRVLRAAVPAAEGIEQEAAAGPRILDLEPHMPGVEAGETGPKAP